jgi:glycosyltransferase involved in cell wall biosynthesis
LTGFYARHFGADVVVSLYDIWALPADTRQQLRCPWIAMIPVDGAPVSEQMLRRIRGVDWPVAFSQFGQNEMAKAGVEADYIPLGVDCQTFSPGDKAEARARLGISQDVYLVTMIAANKGFPARKSWPEAMAAFAQFHARHPETRLYLHTTAQPFGSKGRGVYLKPLAQELGIVDAVIFANEGELAVGVPDEQMADIYRASDVLLNPAMGEGFCLPAAEAQSCGCPVVTQDCSAMSELTVNGIAIEPLQPYWIPQLGYWWQQAGVERIREALEQIYLWDYDDAPLCAWRSGVNFIKNHYDWPIVMSHYWKPFLDKVEAELW